MLNCINGISRELWAFLCTSNGIPFSFSFFKVKSMAQIGDTDIVIHRYNSQENKLTGLYF